MSFLSSKQYNAYFFTSPILGEKNKKASVFYLCTGCRKTEPFIADLNGKWLKIKSTDSKSHRTRDVKLNEVTKGIVQEIGITTIMMNTDRNQEM